jgi:hypothetical protein
MSVHVNDNSTVKPKVGDDFAVVSGRTLIVDVARGTELGARRPEHRAATAC